MGGQKLLLTEINAASRHIGKALRLSRRLAGMRAAHPDEQSLPSGEECFEWIAGLAGNYQGAVARYRLAVEKNIRLNTKSIVSRPARKPPLGGMAVRNQRRS